ncbi:fungistatic metabolite, partial [Hyphodiscus hymeniophilus]
MCINDCSGAGYGYAGVEYGRECWCGNSLASGSVHVTDQTCDMTCSGDESTICGGHSLLSIYVAGSLPLVSTTASVTPSSTTSSVYSGPTTVPSVGTCYFVGCYSEATNSRALTGASYYDYSATGMTVEKCAASCGPQFFMFGVEWSGECYCGNSLQPGSALMTVDQCAMPCDGDKTEFCGGSSHLDLYYCPPAPIVLTATSTVSDYTSTITS